MITTPRAARFLRTLPETDAAALIDAVHDVAANPLANPRHCKKLAPRLYECRASLPPSRQYRLMFAFRPDGQLVLLSACLKTSLSTHERAIRAARAELASDDIPQGVAMPRERPIFSPESGWLYDSTGRQLRIVHMTRRKVVIDTDHGRVELRRARLEQDGQDVVDGVRYHTSRYSLPSEAMEHIA